MSSDLVVQIKNTPFSRAKVDILIPFHEQHDKVSALINSILLNVKSNPYRITLIDDGSANREFISTFKDYDKGRPMGAQPILQFIRNEQRLGFAKALEKGLEATRNPWLMIMHSDCLVEDPQWMLEMGKSLLLLKNKNVKMVSAKCQKPYPGVTHKIVGRKRERKADVVLEDGFLPLFCVMCHRDLFRHIGGFIKNYTTYEDEELAIRMNHHGYKQAICGSSFIYHEGGCTYNYLVKKHPEILEEMDRSRELAANDIRSLLR
ncbi:MAG: glycosyltransferase [Crenarchaeota archaeon]|nr:MAG: glycosyltransferase [Thermoproteota archaeon]